MPTILYVGSFRIVINTNDHGPAHVHCIGPGVSVVIKIATQEIMRNRGVVPKDVKRLQNVVEEFLIDEWRRYHEEK